MAWVREMGNRLRAFLVVALLIGVVLIDSVSRIISMCTDGFLAALILLLVWPLIKSK
jgi:hypothetical protein